MELFSSITTRYSTLTWHFAIILFSLLIMTAGIQRGIEKINRVFMPLFFFLFCVLAIRVFFLEDSSVGYQFLWKTDFDKIWLESAQVAEISFLGQPARLSPYSSEMRAAIVYVHQHPVMFSAS